MPLDGLSFSNAEMYRAVTPLDISIQAENINHVNQETTIRKINEADKSNPDVESSDEDARNDLAGSYNDEEQDDNNEQKSFIDRKENVKKYKVKFNRQTEMVELVDIQKGVVVETITPDDLINIISKSKDASGILVDRKI